jgi:hypothetical protein
MIEREPLGKVPGVPVHEETHLIGLAWIVISHPSPDPDESVMPKDAIE